MTTPPKLVLLSGLIVLISFSVATVTIFTLYGTALDQSRVRLIETVQSQARLIEAISAFDKKSLTNYRGDAVLEQLRQAHAAYVGFGVTGEFTLAKAVDGQIVFLLSHRHGTSASPSPVSMHSRLAEPMQAALAGKSTSLIGLDYRAERVLAATEPVRGLGWGLVAKIDLSEVRAPFVQAGFIALALTAILTAIGVAIFRRMTSPIIDKLREGDLERHRLHATLDALINSFSDAVFVKDRSGRFLIANPAFCTQLGRLPEEVIGADDLRLFPNEFALRYREDDQRVLREGRAMTYEEQGPLSSGEIRTFLTTKGPLVVDDEIRGVFAISKDITDRLQAQVALEESEARYRLLVENQSDLIVKIDTQGHFQFISPSYCQLVNKTEQELLGKSFMSLVYEEDRESTAEAMRDLYRPPFRCDLEQRAMTMNGWRYFAWANNAVLDEEENVVSVIGIGRDITERKTVEKELAESERRLRTLMDNLPGMAYRCKNIQEWTMQFVSDGCTTVTGYKASDLIANRVISYRDLIHPSDQKKVWKSTQRALDQNQPYELEYRIQRKGGGERWVWEQGRGVVFEGSEPMVLEGYITDITERKQALVALAESETLFRATFDQAAVGIARVGTGGQWLDVNQKLCEIVGYPREELLAKTFQDITYPDDLDADFVLFNDTLAGKRHSYAMDKRYIKQSGDLVWVRLTVSLVRANNATPLYFISVVEDIDERKKADEKLREAAAVFRSTGEGVTITDRSGKILDVNDAFTHITGYSRQDVIGGNPRLLKSGRHDEDFYRDMWDQLKKHGLWRGEIWNRTKNGTVYPEILTISVIESESGEPAGYVGVFADISSLKATEARLDHMAHHDPLTDLPNRLLFRDRLKHSLEGSKRKRTKVAVVFLDLDRFKNINDTLGHSVGDQLLLEIARRLRQVTRSSDTIGRISGDEFCLVLEDLHAVAEAAPIVDKLISVFADPFLVESHSLRVSASIGVAIYPDNSQDADSLLSYADAAMYEAKEAGRNTYRFYTSTMTEQALEQSFVQSALREALEQSQFFLTFQPQIDLNTNALTSLEVLVRWRHPERGLIPPSTFIPIAEQSGLIRDLGAWILRTACAQGQAWLDNEREFGRIFVNVAGPQLHDDAFPELVRSCLDDTLFPAEKLGLEVTEGFVMRASEHAIDVLLELRNIGIELAIDDFGTGYSSLSYLKKLPIDKLKIDQSFVRDIPKDQNDMAIAEAVIVMGRALNLKVIAEGVEETEQADFLLDKGCQEAQGYLYGRPLTPAQMETWMDRAKDVVA